MLKKLALAAAATVALSAPALAQDVFAVTGADIGHTTDNYTGKVTVTKSGDTWNVVWQIAGDKTTRGTGVVLEGCCLAVTGVYEGKPFVFLLKADGAKYVGVWTVAGETRMGRETWIPQ